MHGGLYVFCDYAFFSSIFQLHRGQEYLRMFGTDLDINFFRIGRNVGADG